MLCCIVACEIAIVRAGGSLRVLLIRCDLFALICLDCSLYALINLRRVADYSDVVTGSAPWLHASWGLM